MTPYQIVARFTILNDGDVVVVGLNTIDNRMFISSEMDTNEDLLTFNDVRRTIYYAMGERPRTCQMPLVITDLVRHHTELTPDTIVVEYCTPAQCEEFLTYNWDSIVANKIIVTFTVAGEVTA